MSCHQKRECSCPANTRSSFTEIIRGEKSPALFSATGSVLQEKTVEHLSELSGLMTADVPYPIAVVMTFRPPMTDRLTPVTPGCKVNDNQSRKRKRKEREVAAGFVAKLPNKT